MDCPRCRQPNKEGDEICFNCSALLSKSENAKVIDAHINKEAFTNSATKTQEEDREKAKMARNNDYNITGSIIRGDIIFPPPPPPDPKKPESATKFGQKCPICKRLVKDNYFTCSKCNRDLICNEHQDPKTYFCNECAREIKPEAINCALCGHPIEDGQQSFTCKLCAKGPLHKEHYNKERRCCEACAEEMIDDEARNKALGFVARGDHYKESNNFQRALDLYQDAEKVCPKMAEEIWEKIQEVERRKDEQEKKLDEQAKLRKLQESLADIMLLVNTQKFIEAQRDLDKLRVHFPENAEIKDLLEDTKLKKQKYDEKAEERKNSEEIKQKTEIARREEAVKLISQGSIFSDLSKYEEALKKYQEAKSLCPEMSAQILILISQVETRKKEFLEQIRTETGRFKEGQYNNSLKDLNKPDDNTEVITKQQHIGKRKLMIIYSVVGIALVVIVGLVYTLYISKKESGTITSSPVSSVKSAEGRQKAPLKQPTKAILEAGVFYEKNGKLSSLKDGMTLYSNNNYAIYFRPIETSYLYIFQVDSTGKAFKLFPNIEEYKTIGNPLKANLSYWIPGEGKFFYLDAVVGKEELFFFASKNPIQALEGAKTTTKAMMEETTKLMGVGGTAESNVSGQVVTKSETLPFEMVRTKVTSTGDLVYSVWFWHK
jgi:tetratricopeptide (TPR) repeat protein